MNMKKAGFAIGFALVLAAALPLRAQTGCTDSPEAPTILLAHVGAAGAFASRIWRSRRWQDEDQHFL